MSSILNEIFEQDPCYLESNWDNWQGSYYKITTDVGYEYVVPSSEVDPIHSIKDVLDYISVPVERVKHIDKKYGWLLSLSPHFEAFDKKSDAQLYTISKYSAYNLNETTYDTSIGKIRVSYVPAHKMDGIDTIIRGYWLGEYIEDNSDLDKYSMGGNTKGGAIKALLKALGK